MEVLYKSTRSDIAPVKASEAILKGLNEECDVFYVLVNYTMLFETQNILKDLEGNK